MTSTCVFFFIRTGCFIACPMMLSMLTLSTNAAMQVRCFGCIIQAVYIIQDTNCVIIYLSVYRKRDNSLLHKKNSWYKSLVEFVRSAEVTTYILWSRVWTLNIFHTTNHQWIKLYYNMTVWHFGPCVTFWPCLCDISARLVWHFGPLVRNEGKRVSPYPHINHWRRL